MAHFAQIKDGIVIQVVVAEPEIIALLEDGHTQWIQTSYNTSAGKHTTGGTPLRKNYAGIGYSYDADRDAFIPPSPWPSWLLDEDTCLWRPPVPKPDNVNSWDWDETAGKWVKK